MTSPTWKDVPADLRAQIIAVYDNPDAMRAIADTLDLSVDTLRRYARRHRENLELLTGETVPKFDESRRLALTAALKTFKPKLSRAVTPVQGPLTDLRYLDLNTDQGQWLEWLHDTAATKPNISVMHLSDAHAPFQNDSALDVAYQLVAHVQPDFIGVGSDFADMAVISPFGTDPDIDEECADVLDQFETHYHAYIDGIIDANPNAVRAYLLGNHERRIFRFFNSVGGKFRHTIMNRFIEIARYRGTLWLGETDYVRLGPLIVQHGNRHNIHAAKSMLEDMGGQVSTMAGHKHFLTSFAMPGEDFSVHGITGGCLCERKAHCHRGAKQTRKYQLGTAIADVELNGREVLFNNLEFTEYPDRVSVRFERQTFESATKRPEGSVTFEEYLARRDAS